MLWLLSLITRWPRLAAAAVVALALMGFIAWVYHSGEKAGSAEIVKEINAENAGARNAAKEGGDTVVSCYADGGMQYDFHRKKCVRP